VASGNRDEPRDQKETSQNREKEHKQNRPFCFGAFVCFLMLRRSLQIVIHSIPPMCLETPRNQYRHRDRSHGAGSVCGIGHIAGGAQPFACGLWAFGHGALGREPGGALFVAPDTFMANHRATS
jgi:hypothetical protein